MSDEPLVSIIMSAWQPRLGWLRQAVAGVLDQQGCRFELIVVDDGSPDPVASSLPDVADERLRVIRVDHGGASHARNAGVRAARGEFFRFVDADDVLEGNSTARLLKLAHDGNTIAYGATLECDEHLRPLGLKRSHLNGWIAEECLLYRFDVTHVSMLFPRRVVETVGAWDTTMHQCGDWDFVLRAVEQAPVRGDQQIATYYRRHGKSLSANIERALYYESRVVDRYFERHPGQAGTALEREARAKLLVVRARASSSLGAGRRKQMMFLCRALAMHPRRAIREIAHELREVGRRLTSVKQSGRPTG